MKISRKCQYALKAVFELAWRNAGEPVKTRDIAEAQRISRRFMEVILNELKRGGFVESRRGSQGGYMLARDARVLTVGEVIEYIQGPISFAPDVARTAGGTPSWGDEAFTELWQEVNNAVFEACHKMSFGGLVEFERAKRRGCVPDYSI